MDIRVVAFDIFGTTVDWYTGVADQVARLLPDVDAGDFASRWRAEYVPSMARVRDGERAWAYLDTLHRESLDGLLGDREVDEAADRAADVTCDLYATDFLDLATRLGA